MADTFATFLKRGLVAGLVGGAAGAVCLMWLSEPSIREALRIEAGIAEDPGHEEMFSRGVQVVGGVTAVFITGLVLGLVFTVVFVKVRNRAALPTDSHVAVAVGTLGFLVQGLIPWLKYPPNPPGVGDPDTINERTVSYLALLALAVCALLLASEVASRLTRRGVDQPTTWLAAVVVAVGLVAIGYIVLPAADPVPPEVGSDLLWQFRLASIGGLAAMWSALSLTMAILCRARPRRASPTTATKHTVPR